MLQHETMAKLSDETATNVSTAADVGRQVLSLAGDALCLAATALRLTLLPSSTPGHNAHLREVSLKEVAIHDSREDCWIVIHDLVYDISKFMHKHPGGLDILLEYAGRDATFTFRSFHDDSALKSLEFYVVGRLPAHECLYDSR